MQSSMDGPQGSAVLAPPLRDFAFDRFGDVASHQLADLLVDRAHQLGARAIDDGLQMTRELILESRIGEKVQALQHLQGDLFGERGPALFGIQARTCEDTSSKYEMCL